MLGLVDVGIGSVSRVSADHAGIARLLRRPCVIVQTVMIRLLAPSTLALSIVACSGCGGEELSHQIDDAQGQIDLLREDVDAHAAAAAAAPDLAALQQAEAPHQELVQGHMDGLGHAIDDMYACDGASDHRVDSMMDVHDTCEDELDRHREAIAGATSLDAARAEEQHHRTEMMGQLDDLDDMMDDMMDDHGMAMCWGHHGMDAHEGG